MCKLSKKFVSIILIVILTTGMIFTAVPAAYAYESYDSDFYVTGSEGLCGTDWLNDADPNTYMSYDDDSDCYYAVFDNVDAGTYSFKVIEITEDGEIIWHPGGMGNDSRVKVEEDGATVRVELELTGDPDSDKAVAYVYDGNGNGQDTINYDPGFYVTGDEGLCGRDWGNDDDPNTYMYYDDDEDCYYRYFEDVPAGTYYFKVIEFTEDGDIIWHPGGMGNDSVVEVEEDGSTVYVELKLTGDPDEDEATANSYSDDPIAPPGYYVDSEMDSEGDSFSSMFYDDNDNSYNKYFENVSAGTYVVQIFKVNEDGSSNWYAINGEKTEAEVVVDKDGSDVLVYFTLDDYEFHYMVTPPYEDETDPIVTDAPTQRPTRAPKTEPTTQVTETTPSPTNAPVTTEPVDTTPVATQPAATDPTYNVDGADNSGDLGPNCNWYFLKNSQTLVIKGNGATEGRISDLDVTQVKSVVIEDGVTSFDSIDYSLFYCNPSIESLVVAKSVREIGDGVIWGCTNLRTVRLNEGLLKLGENVFWDCKSLTSIEIPNSVTEVGESLFHGCSSLVSVKLGSGIKTLPQYMFNGCSKLANISFAEDLKEIGDNAFFGCASLTDFVVPASAEKVGDAAFFNCTGLRKVTFLGKNTQINNGAFLACDFKNLVIYGYSGSPAQSVATYNAWQGLRFVALDGHSSNSSSNSGSSNKGGSVSSGKKLNTISVSVKKKTVKAKKLKKKKQTVKPLTVKNAKGSISVTKVRSGSSGKIYSKVKVNRNTGAITLKKGKYKKGTYKINLKITASGNSSYYSKTIYKTVKIKVK